MNKELTPLEALERLRPKTTYLPYYTRNEKRYYCDIIETALKDYEQLKIVAKPLTDEEKKSINSVARRLKALEIIKEKNVNTFLVRQCKNYIEYNRALANQGVVGARHFNLTQEEFDLLKEVLK